MQGTNLETLCKVRGTYAYIGPEVYFGQSFTPKSDVYAFGASICAFFMICPFCNTSFRHNFVGALQQMCQESVRVTIL